MWRARPFVSLVLAISIASSVDAFQLDADDNFGVGNPSVFVPKYLSFRAQQLARTNPDVLTIPLGQVKGLSRSFNAPAGEMTVNLRTGAFNIRLNRLTTGLTYGVWLIDDRSALVPGVTDSVFRLATLLAAAPTALLNGTLGGLLGITLPAGFTLDRVIVARGLLSSSDVLSSGSVNVFQKIFFRRLSLINEGTGETLFTETTSPPSLSTLVPDIATEIDESSSPSAIASSSKSATMATSSNRSAKLDKLISKGARLFFEETFGGNGRTCGTCHPSNNNFTIDPPFIAARPANDPLFVAEFNPALANLERPQLMRSFGLILENVDGLEDPTQKFVMRGVPHTIGLQVSLARDSTLPSPPVEMTGWSGDGAPQTGSLRDFAIGAVTQHFTKSLERVRGRDFKLPKEPQLDAMEAFQLSIGRTADFNLASITFNDANVDTGKAIFLNGTGDPNAGAICAFCHGNGGALAGSLNNENRNFNTNVEDVVHPARALEPFPVDGGFGQTANPDGTFGNRSFNTASAVEAADTGPFFHNNVVATLEDVLRFYSGPEFNTPRAPSARFSFNETQINQIADFLRALNTLQNIDMASTELVEILALQGNKEREIAVRLQTAFDETQDAIDVLGGEGLFPAAVARLTAARSRIAQAQQSTGNQRRTLVQQAITELRNARGLVASP
jgi:cytochrome c peroxidase